MTIYAFGAYGTNNVGDEAIFAGLSLKYPGIKAIYINKSKLAGAVWYADILEKRFKFAKEDHLIIGGGGLLYSADAIRTMLQLTELIHGAGGSMSVEGVGCEALQDDYAQAVRELLHKAVKVSVRSTMSAALLKEKLGFSAEVVPDFAFGLQHLFVKAPRDPKRLPRIGLVLSGDAFHQPYSAMTVTIRKNTIGNPIAEFIHIPHSRSYVDKFNNDVLVGEMLWSTISIYHAEREDRFRCHHFSNDVAEISKVYNGLDAVLSERYHGIVFGMMTGIPVLAAVGNAKNRSLLADRPDANVSGFTTDEELQELVGRTVKALSTGAS